MIHKGGFPLDCFSRQDRNGTENKSRENVLLAFLLACQGKSFVLSRGFCPRKMLNSIQLFPGIPETGECPANQRVVLGDPF